MSEASNSLLSEWTNIITAIATCSAVGVALFLHFHHLRKQKAAKIAEDEKNAVIALQAIYSELRALDAYFLIVELNLHNLNDESAISIIAKLGNPKISSIRSYQLIWLGIVWRH